ncbi:MAG TPA: EAL domain-containing protein [Abditibacterium sp.]
MNTSEQQALDASQTKIPADVPGYYEGEPSVQAVEQPVKELDQSEQLKGAWHGMILPNQEDVAVGEPQCQRCEVLPRPMTEAGTLALRFPHTFTLGKVVQYLADSAWKHSHRDGLVQIQVPAGMLPTLLSPIMDMLSSPEQRDTQAIYQFAGEIPQVQDFFEVESLPDFVAEVRSAWLIEVLRDKAIYSVFQPIVRCGTRPHGLETDVLKVPEIFGYECLMRGSYKGEVVSPLTMLEMARAADLVFQLDLAARRSALLGAGQNRIKQKVFINFSPNAVYDPWHCLRSTVNTVDEVGLRRDQVVFELTETERMPEIKHLKRIVQFYREEGFQVALDDVGSGYSSLNVLVALRPDYVKIDMDLIRDVDKDAAKAIVAGKLLETVCELGLATVAEGIERHEELAWVRDHGSTFAQGYLFARPATPPPVLGG